VAHRSATQVRNKHRVESLIRLAAPALDLVLYTGERVSKVVGRNQLGPEPAIRQVRPGLDLAPRAGRPGLPPSTRH
jgi:hypothetical protein